MAECSNCKGDRVQVGICLDCGYQPELETTRARSKPETTDGPRPRKATRQPRRT